MLRLSALTRSSTFLLAGLLGGLPLYSQHLKCSRDVNAAPPGPVNVIVQYKSDINSDDLRKVSNLGASVGKHLHSIHSMQATVSTAMLDALVADDKVRYVSLDRPIVARGSALPIVVPQNPASIATTAEFTNEPINAPAMWNLGYTGTGIGVAVIDSGINSVADFSTQTYSYSSGGYSYSYGWSGAGSGWNYGVGSRIVYSQSFVPGQTNVTADAFGHGTHVAGLVGGNGQASTGGRFFRTFSGVAPNVNLINLRALDQNGMSTDSTVIAAIEQAIALKNTYNIKVINLSLGRPVFESYTLDPLDQAVEQAWKAGIVVVAAAGNNGRNTALNSEAYGTIEAPGNDPYVITVGAANTSNTVGLTDDVMASYSSKGPTFIDQISKPDIIAPGNLVTSVTNGNSNIQTANPTFYTPMSFYQHGGGKLTESNDYMPLSGTSMSTGVTSGAVALLLQAVPSITPDQVKAVLMRDANKTIIPASNTVTDPASGLQYIAHNDVFTQGAGYLDIAAAINDALKMSTTTTSSTAAAGLAGPAAPAAPAGPAAPGASASASSTTATVLPTGTAMSPVAVFVASNNSVVLVPDGSSLWGTTAYWGSANVYGSSAFVGGSTAYWGSAILTGASNPASQTAYWGSSVLSGSTTLAGASDVNAYTALWNSNAIAGSTAYWGSATSAAASILWGNTAYWGSSTTSGNTAYWGSSTTSGTTAYWGSSTTSGATAYWGASVSSDQ